MSTEVLSVANEYWVIVTTRVASPSQREGQPCEDAIGAELLADGGCVIAVADGVGSGARGDVCAAAAVDHSLQACARAVPRGAHVRGLLASADSAVRAALAQHTSSRGATTLVGAWLDASGCGFVGHCGDSRAYVARQDSAEAHVDRVTLDHSYRNLGLVAPFTRSPDDPARMLGLGSCGTADVGELLVAPGGVVILCTDGVHAYLPDGCLESCIAQTALELHELDAESATRRLAELGRSLVEQAREHSSRDDASIVLAWRRRMPQDHIHGGLSCRTSC
jgi:PPM family protein phosphatase